MRSRLRNEEAMGKQQEALSEAQQIALEREEREGPPPEEEAQGGMPPMPEDPTQAGPAQERLQGGPEAQQIQQREFEANAPT